VNEPTVPYEAEDKRVSWAELFFDLVFVFAVTEVSARLQADHRGLGPLRALVVFVPIYWTWAGITLQANIRDVSRPALRLAMFTVALCGLFAALAIPYAFEGRAVLFASAYWVGRIVMGIPVLASGRGCQSSGLMAAEAFAALNRRLLRGRAVAGAVLRSRNDVGVVVAGAAPALLVPAVEVLRRGDAAGDAAATHVLDAFQLRQPGPFASLLRAGAVRGCTAGECAGGRRGEGAGGRRAVVEAGQPARRSHRAGAGAPQQVPDERVAVGAERAVMALRVGGELGVDGRAGAGDR
jgi:hypothetical protein